MCPDICDGYTETWNLSGVETTLRPFTRHDRPLIGAYLHELSNVMANRAERRLVLSRVVDCDGEIEDLYGERLWELAMGINNTEQEIDDETNLTDGVYLLTRYPWMERTTCEQCKTWLWNPLTGELARSAGEPPLKRQGEPLCEGSDLCPRGHWRDPLELSAKNKQAVRFHKAHEAALPDDPIVQRNARLIRDAERRARADQAVNGGAGRGSQRADQLRRAGLGRHRGIARAFSG